MKMFSSFFNTIFAPLINLGTPWSVLLVSFILTALVTIAYKVTTDQTMMKTLKGDLKKIQKEIREFKDQPDKMMALQKKAMEINMKYIKHSFKPMLLTFLPLILVFGWLRDTYPSERVVLQLPFSLPLIGNSLGWFGTYIISSIIFTVILRKILKVH